MALSRRVLAERLVDLQIEAEPILLKIDALKEQLREICTASGEAFKEEVAGKGSVEVKAGSEAKLKGILPELEPAAFLALPEKRRQALIDGDVVKMAEQWSKATKPSVTVRL